MKKKHFDIAMFVATLIASLIAAALATFVLFPKLNALSAPLQTGIYLGVSAVLMVIAVLIAAIGFNGKSKLKKGKKDGGYQVGYLKDFNERYKGFAIIVGIVFIVLAFAIGWATEAIYAAIGKTSGETTFGGSYIVADFSGSMLKNDEHGDMKKSIADYIKSVPDGERFGITLYNTYDEIIPEKPDDMDEEDYEEALKMFDGYTAFTGGNKQKENVIELINATPYDGQTVTNGALLLALNRVVTAVGNDDDKLYSNNRELQHYPGLIMLYSDGSPTDVINYREIARLSTGYGSSRITPINTIYFRGEGEDIYGAAVMREISRVTGGNFSYTGYEDAYADVFAASYDSFKIPEPNLLFTATGPLADNFWRGVLQFVLIYVWMILSVFAVYLMLGNKKLKMVFVLPKLIWALVFTIISILLIQSGDMVLLIVGQSLVTLTFVAVIPAWHFELTK
jgi:hypothetical protein